MEIKTAKNYLGEVINILVSAKSDILSDDELSKFSLNANSYYNKFEEAIAIKNMTCEEYLNYVVSEINNM